MRLAVGSVTSSTKTSVLIRQERNGEPGALVTALTTQSPLVDGVNTFAAPANTTLNPQTNYFVTVNEATPPPTGAPEGVPFAPGPRAVYELTGSREQSGADGWSINDKRLYKNHLSQEWGTSDRIFLLISVNGDVHTPNTEQQVEIVVPTVDGTPSVSGAGTDAQWSVGETVGVTVTFSEAVDLDTSGGTPSIGIGLGGTAARSATYASGTGTTELVFGYTLVQSDGSHSLMAVTPASLALNGGTILSAESQTSAQLAHNGTVVLGSSTRSAVPEVSFQDVPKSHDGATAFTVGVQFSGQPAGLSATRDAASVLEVTGARVTGARVTSKGANPAWEVTVAPDGLGEVTIEVPVRACTEANAVCIGGRSLSRAVETTVPGTPMTARFTQAPSAHDGSNGFELHMEFSHEPKNFSYRTVQGALFDIEGGRIERVWRRERGKDRQWGIFVVPDGGGAVTLAARATSDCAAQNAVCDAEGWKFAGELSLTVPGPASSSPPVVSIAASATPVTEGAAAAFTLSRTGATDAALTVSVSVSESEASVSGTPPTSVTFAAASASATLSVATEDDEVAEDASTVTATVSAGAGYTVSGTSGSADVVVEDDDATPVVTTASPIVVAENATSVATLSATDADTAAADLSWSIPTGAAGGADAAQFALTADGVLSFSAAKDFEAPDDTDTDGQYEVTVRVTDGANPVDAALLVRLEDADDAAPALTGATVDGAALTLTFGEALDEGSVPPASSFAVTVAGSARAVDSAAVSGSTVVLTLSSAVTSGEMVTVGYTVPTGADAKPVQDAAGNRTASVADAEVTNGTAPALLTVSIAAVSTPVTEGAAAAFVLRRTGAVTSELTVTVSVSEAGSVLDSARPSSATFASGASEARLTVATANDAVNEADTRVSASVVAGDGYEVDAENASAGVDVFDDDAAPQVAAVEELWSTTLTWTDLGNNWFGGFADGFSNPGWSEDGQAFRIWYIAYDAGSGELLMAHDGSGGVIAEPGQLALHVGGLEVGPGEALSAFAGARVGRGRRRRCAVERGRAGDRAVDARLRGCGRGARRAGVLGGRCAGKRGVGCAASVPGDARCAGTVDGLGALSHGQRYGGGGPGLCGGARGAALRAGRDGEDRRGSGASGQPRRGQRDDDAHAVCPPRGDACRRHRDGDHQQHRRDTEGVDRALRGHRGGAGAGGGGGPDAGGARARRRGEPCG